MTTITTKIDLRGMRRQAGMQADEMSIMRSGGEDDRRQGGIVVKRNIKMPGKWDERKEGGLSEADMLPAMLTMSSTTVPHMTWQTLASHCTMAKAS
jgi:hypothetical protein